MSKDVQVVELAIETISKDWCKLASCEVLRQSTEVLGLTVIEADVLLDCYRANMKAYVHRAGFYDMSTQTWMQMTHDERKELRLKKLRDFLEIVKSWETA